ncbi:MAG: PHP domain-containing protein [Dehalococcoidia bacterium]
MSSATDVKIDLHMHTTASDGRLAPAELVRLLAQRQVDVAAVSDHDTTEGLDAVFAEAAQHPGLRIVPAIEISADHPTDPKADVHVLGYFLQYHNHAFQARLSVFREDREERGFRMVEKLAALGYTLDWERVKEIAEDASIGRPHIARALMERGYVPTIKAAFNGLLEDSGPAFVDRPHISMRESADLIRSVGGVAVLAHPLYVPDYESVLAQLADLGFVGFEVHYGDFAPEQRNELARLAERYGMLPCGGSDYHAMGHDNEQLPGAAGPPPEVFEKLESLANR